MTSTELATFEQPREIAMATNSQDAAVVRLGQWAQSADAAYRVAQRLVETSFVPQAYRGKPVEATAAILAGTEIGLSPMSALKAFDNIQGQAAPKAITLRAVAQSHGHQIVLVESTETRCRMKGRRKGETEWQAVTWTIDRAKSLQLTGKDNWKKQPGAMLVARATSELARLIASDAILGIGYSSEELVDGADPDSPAPAAATIGRTRLSRRPRTEQQETSPVDASEETPTGDLITEAQSKKMFALYNQLGMTDRAERLADTAGFIERDVTSSSELTVTEATRLIDDLDRRVGDEHAALFANDEKAQP